MKRSLVFLLTLMVASALSLGGPRLLRSEPEAKYAGDETCQQCHQDKWDAFQKNPHGRAAMDGAVVADRVGCESCHGPGSAHAEAGGDKTAPGFATVRNFKKLPAAQASEVCAGCHKAGEQFYWEHSTHARNGVSCVQCHSVHHSMSPDGGPPLLKTSEVTPLCVTCHKDKRASIARSAHMPIREGAITCASCHNPHGTPTDKMLRASTPNELCLTCHSDKRGPFLWEHAPVRENCMNCHQPHGSAADKALGSKRPYLCQRCHVATRHPSTLYDANDLATNRLLNRACNNCHSQIHGSNHPSGNFFLR